MGALYLRALVPNYDLCGKQPVWSNFRLDANIGKWAFVFTISKIEKKSYDCDKRVQVVNDVSVHREKWPKQWRRVGSVGFAILLLEHSYLENPVAVWGKEHEGVGACERMFRKLLQVARRIEIRLEKPKIEAIPTDDFQKNNFCSWNF